MWRKLLVLLAFFSLASGLEARVKSSADDELAVRTVVSRLASTAQDATPAARAALFADDAQIINAFGQRVEGRKEIENFWNTIFSSGMFRTTRNEEKALKITFLTPELALADRFYVFSGQRGPNSGRELPPRAIHTTLILRKQVHRWLIIYYSVADLRTVGR